jgi:hypothetical protein
VSSEVAASPAPAVNVAVTDFAASIATVHGPVPVQAPLQPENDEPASAVAARVTDVPLANASEQSEPHAIPPGVLVTVPVPVPSFATDSV